MASMRYKNNKRLVLIIDVGNDFRYLYEFSIKKGGGFKVKNVIILLQFFIHIFQVRHLIVLLFVQIYSLKWLLRRLKITFLRAAKFLGYTYIINCSFKKS